MSDENTSGSERGIVYISANDSLIQEAIESAKSAREHNPELPIALVTDDPLKTDLFDDIFVRDIQGGFADKPNEMLLPYDKTLYLDTDTLIAGSLDSIFEVLDNFDLAAVHNYDNFSWETCKNESIPNSFPEYNTGVIAFRKSDRVEKFLRDWKATYQNNPELRPGDQPSFREALYQADLRIATLPFEYNCKFRYPGLIVDNIVIFHGRLGNVDSEGATEQYSARLAKKQLNGYDVTRAFAPKPSGGFTIIHARSSLHALRTRYLDSGIRGVIRGILDRFR